MHLTLAPARTATVAPTAPATAPQMPTPMAERVLLQRQLVAAVSQAQQSVESYLQAHPHGQEQTFQRWVVASVAPMPDAAGTAVELAELHRIKATRTPQLDVAARWMSNYGDHDVWYQLLDEGLAGVAPAQARAATRLLDDAMSLAARTKNIGKAQFARTRPYQLDPSLDPIFAGGTLAPIVAAPSPSYPSGHASEAYAGAAVLSYLFPERAEEFRQLAGEVAWSRLYAGVHFRSDVIEGAALGTRIGIWLAARDASHQTPVRIRR